MVDGLHRRGSADIRGAAAGVGGHVQDAPPDEAGPEVCRGPCEQLLGAVWERLPERPTGRRKVLPGATYSPDEFTHSP